MKNINSMPDDLSLILGSEYESEAYSIWGELVENRTPEGIVYSLMHDNYSSIDQAKAEELEVTMRKVRVDFLNEYLSKNPLPLVNAVFEELRSNGVVALDGFSCCGTCGHYEISSKIDLPMEVPKNSPGYVFFNEQTAEQILDFQDGYVGYGCFDDSDPVEFIKKNVLPIFAKHGLKFNWRDKALSFTSPDWFADIR